MERYWDNRLRVQGQGPAVLGLPFIRSIAFSGKRETPRLVNFENSHTGKKFLGF